MRRLNCSNKKLKVDESNGWFISFSVFDTFFIQTFFLTDSSTVWVNYIEEKKLFFTIPTISSRISIPFFSIFITFRKPTGEITSWKHKYKAIYFSMLSVRNSLNFCSLEYLAWNCRNRYWKLGQNTMKFGMLSSLLWLSSCFFSLLSDVLDFVVHGLVVLCFKHDFVTSSNIARRPDGCFPQ